MLDELLESVVLGILALCTIYITGRSKEHMEKSEHVMKLQEQLIEKQSQYIDTLFPQEIPKKKRRASGEKVIPMVKRKT